MHHQRHGHKQERYLLLVQLSATSPLHGLIIGRVALANINKPDKVGSSFLVSKGLKSYVQAVTKGKPNPYVLWHALKDQLHNKSLNLQANLQWFNAA